MMKCKKMFLITLTICLCLMHTNGVVKTQTTPLITSSDNLALGKPVSVSGVENGSASFDGKYAVDGIVAKKSLCSQIQI